MATDGTSDLQREIKCRNCIHFLSLWSEGRGHCEHPRGEPIFKSSHDWSDSALGNDFHFCDEYKGRAHAELAEALDDFFSEISKAFREIKLVKRYLNWLKR